MKLFDSHCHLNDEKFNENRDETIKAIFNSGVSRLINAGYSLESSKSALQIANKYTQIYAVCGISPNDIKDNIDETLYEIEEIKNIIKNQNKVIGIGEIGLDYHWNIDNKELQKLAFTKQIELANQLEFPIVIHTREAVMDTIQILKQHEVYKKGVFHCCPLNPELVKEALKLGFYISFAGPVTFKNSKNADDVVKMVPINRILIETDSPYLSPEPLRGKLNTPSNVKYVAEKIANIKGVSIEEIAEITYKNTCDIFNIEI